MAAGLVSRLRPKVALPIPNASRNTVGLDIEPNAFVAVELTHGSSEPKRVVTKEIPGGLFSQGEYANEDELASELKQFFRENKLGKRVRIGVASNRAVLRTLQIPRIDDVVERDAAIKFKAAELLPLPLDSAVLDYRVVEHSTTDEASYDHVVVVAAPRELVEPMDRVIRKAGLKLEQIDLAAFGVMRAMAGQRAQGDGATAYCYLGASTTVAVGTGSACVFARTFFSDHNRDEEEGVSSVHRATGELSTSLEYYRSTPDAFPIEEMLVCGPQSGDQEFVMGLNDALGLPVTVAEPTLSSGETSNSFAMAYGLALNEVAH